MPRARSFVLSTLLLLCACAGTPRVALDRAQADAQAGRAAVALRRFDAVAARKDAGDAERIDALLGAARACDALSDDACARARLERAIARDVPGLVEPALFELAERVRNEDRGRAHEPLLSRRRRRPEIPPRRLALQGRHGPHPPDLDVALG